jgi:hypothetical protein
VLQTLLDTDFGGEPHAQRIHRRTQYSICIGVDNETFSGHRAAGAERDKPRRAALRVTPQLLRVPRGLIRSAVIAFGIQFFGMPVEQFQLTVAAPAFELTFCIRPHGRRSFVAAVYFLAPCCFSTSPVEKTL